MLQAIKSLTFIFFIASFAGQAACEDSASGLVIQDVWARAGKPNSAAFMKIKNESSEDRKIISAKADVSNRIELHDHLRDGDVMKMRKVDTLVVPAGDSIELMPGGKHLMFFELGQGLTDGQVFKLTLALDNGQQLVVDVPVKAMTYNPKLDNSGCHCKP